MGRYFGCSRRPSSSFDGRCPRSGVQRLYGICSEVLANGWTAAKLGWDAPESDGHTGGLLRETLFGLMTRFGDDPEFTAEARRRFEVYVADPIANAELLKDGSELQC